MTTLNRRDFLILGTTTPIGLACETDTERLRPTPLIMLDQADAAVPDIGHTIDGGFQDAGHGVHIGEKFMVHLNDANCSAHHHGAAVAAGTYGLEEIVQYLGGSHAVSFTGAQLGLLARGARIPYSTGNAIDGGHGHCGLAWRSDVARPDSELRVDCSAIEPATCVAR